MEPLTVVENYLEAFRRRDFEAARACLADRAFEYISPIASFDDADVFISGMDGVGAILHRLETRQRFVEGNDVCHVLDITVSMDGYETSRLVQLARVKGDRILRLEAIFDATDFHRMIGDPSLG